MSSMVSQFIQFYHEMDSILIIHTYIIGYYSPSVRIIDLVSHTTYVVCVNFIQKWRDLQFKVDSFFEKLFMAILFTLSFCQKSAERKSPKMPDLGYESGLYD